MDKALNIDVQAGPGRGVLSRHTILTRRDFLIPAVLILSVIGAGMVLFLPEMLVMAITVAIPASILLLYIMKNPYAGVMLFFLLEYLRPYDLIPGLMKLRLAMLTLAITLVAFIVLKARTDRSLRWDRFNWLYAGFLGILAIGVFTAANNFFAYNTFYSMGINFLIYILATDLITSTSRLKKLLWLLLIIHTYHSFNGIINQVTGAHIAGGIRTSGNVTSGFLKDENDFALAMNTIMPFAFFLVFNAKNHFKKYLAAVIFIVFVFAVVSSMSRGGWIGMMAVVFFLIWRSKSRVRSFAIVAVMLAAASAFAPPQYWDEIRSISPQEATGASRIAYWKAAIRMFVEHPVIGVGGGNGGVWMPMHLQTATGRDPNTSWGATFHGTLPQVLAETGGMGILFYLGMTVVAIRRLRRVRWASRNGEDGEFLTYIANSTQVALVGYFASATFLSTAFYPQLWTLFIFTTVAYNLSRSLSARTESAVLRRAA